MLTFGEVRILLAPVIDRAQKSGLECDGYTRVFHTFLEKHAVEHTIYLGQLTLEKHVVEPHYWIDIVTTDISTARLDCAAQLWLGDDPAVPNGLFDASRTAAHYYGQAITIPVLPMGIYEILLTPIPFDIFQHK